MILLSRNSAEASLSELDAKLKAAQTGAYSFGQMFVDVVKGTTQETNHLDEAILSDTISHMGDMCIRAVQKKTWHPKAGKGSDYEVANQWFHREMRNPYTV